VNDHIETSTDTQKIRLEASRWLQERTFWEWNAARQAEFERWLAASPSHRVAYLRAKAVWDRTERLSALRRPHGQPLNPGGRKRWALLASAAAIAAIACVVGGSLLGFWKSNDQTSFVTALGERRVLTLADGSQIELNTNSELRLSPSQRQAWLDRGEAYFQIVHDAQHPFSVVVSGKRVEDLGTKFLVHAEGDKFTVSLYEGKAAIKGSDSRSARALAVLEPGDIATATAHSLTVSEKPERALLNEIAWRQNMLVFSNAPLTEVAAELNRYNQRRVVIADPSLARLKIDASIPTNGVEAFARVARNFLGLKVQSNKSEIVISR
jgi:transmembrane sensor